MEVSSHIEVKALYRLDSDLCLQVGGRALTDMTLFQRDAVTESQQVKEHNGLRWGMI